MSIFDDTEFIADSKAKRYGKAKDKKGFVIQFYHLPTAKKTIDASMNSKNVLSSTNTYATFKAFLTAFKDSFKVNWNSKETFGRMDAIQSYKNTQRQISVSFDVPSFDESEAQINFYELQKLIQMQYPVYETIGFKKNPTDPIKNTFYKGRFISSPPLIYVKMLNWIAGDINQVSSQISDYVSDALIATISEVSFNPDLEDGFYFSQTDKLTPKTFKVDLVMTIIHTQELGWTNKYQNSGNEIPYFMFSNPQDKTNDNPNPIQYSYPYSTSEEAFLSEASAQDRFMEEGNLATAERPYEVATYTIDANGNRTTDLSADVSGFTGTQPGKQNFDIETELKTAGIFSEPLSEDLDTRNQRQTREAQERTAGYFKPKEVIRDDFGAETQQKVDEIFADLDKEYPSTPRRTPKR